jgi:undecaprenyl-diphosphatase
MRGLSQIGQPAVLISLGALIVFWLARIGRSRTALLFAIVVAGAELLDQLLKLVFHRPRPVPFFGLATPDGYSFPSGHALVSCAFFGSLAAIAAARTTRGTLRMTYYAAAAATTGAIGFSRIYLGVHYPSDVLGGYAAAVVWCFSVVRWRSRAGPGQGAMGTPR